MQNFHPNEPPNNTCMETHIIGIKEQDKRHNWIDKFTLILDAIRRKQSSLSLSMKCSDFRPNESCMQMLHKIANTPIN
jgi:hypothetical protein